MIQMQSIDRFSVTGLLIVELAPVRTPPQSKEEENYSNTDGLYGQY